MGSMGSGMKVINVPVPNGVDEETFKRIVLGISRRLEESHKRLQELDELLKDSELSDDEAIEMGRELKRRARERGWY